MRTLFSFLITILFSQIIIAQSPQGFHYQAIARDGDELLATQQLEVKFTILELNNVKYKELHATQTNENGLFNLVIGEGAVLSGDILVIDWSSGDYKIKVEVDAGDGFKNLGTQELKSVPFSLFTERAASADRIQGQTVSDLIPMDGQILVWTGSKWEASDNKSAALWSENNNDIFFKAGMVGIGLDNPKSALHLAEGNSLLIGTDTLGAGGKMMFLSSKNAFRAGKVSGAANKFWDSDSVGSNSVAMGSNSLAKGSASIALGSSNKATGNSAISLGSGNTAKGNSSSAMGQTNQAIGNYSLAAGRFNLAEGSNSIALGYSNEAIGTYSFAGGFNTNVEGNYSTAFGRYTETSYVSTAIGRYNKDNGNSTSWIGLDALFTIGNGASTNSRNNAFVVYKNGNATLDGVLTESSDINLKEKINPIENELEKLLKIRGVTYYWKDKELRGNDKQIGVIAQEVQAVFPELVSDRSEHLSVNYSGLIPVLIEAVREQQEMIDQLKKKVETLEKQ